MVDSSAPPRGGAAKIEQALGILKGTARIAEPAKAHGDTGVSEGSYFADWVADFLGLSDTVRDRLCGWELRLCALGAWILVQRRRAWAAFKVFVFYLTLYVFNLEGALLEACTVGDVDAVVELLNMWTPVARTDENGRSPLHLAAAHGHSEIMGFLLAAGAELEAEDHWGATALHLAADNGRQKAMRLLVERGARIYSVDRSGWSPVHRAADSGWSEEVKLLIRAGADRDARDQAGHTPLHLAAGSGHLNVVKALITGGASKSAKTHTGHTALHVARTGEVARALLAAGVDLVPRTHEGATPLHVAAGLGRVAVLRALFTPSRPVAATLTEMHARRC